MKLVSEGQVLAQMHGRLGVLTLNRASALNALSLAMIRDLTSMLLAWAQDDDVDAVLVRGAGREGKPPAFCAGGDIRFFHQAALSGDPRLEDFFTEEYALNHLIHCYPKPYLAWMDGVVMGGGMGISQGATYRLVTEHAKLAMPETNIGLFPDVGGGWFLSRCPGHVGEFLALTGQVVHAGDAIAWGLADKHVPSDRHGVLLDGLAKEPRLDQVAIERNVVAVAAPAPEGTLQRHQGVINTHFAAHDLQALFADLRAASEDSFSAETLQTLTRRSPLMMAVTLEQVRLARRMGLAADLRMERDMVRHCFHLRPGTASETVEGIRALAVDKDHAPRWSPAKVEDVHQEDVEAFFVSPWPVHSHPLRHLAD